MKNVILFAIIATLLCWVACKKDKKPATTAPSQVETDAARTIVNDRMDYLHIDEFTGKLTFNDIDGTLHETKAVVAAVKTGRPAASVVARFAEDKLYMKVSYFYRRESDKLGIAKVLVKIGDKVVEYDGTLEASYQLDEFTSNGEDVLRFIVSGSDGDSIRMRLENADSKVYDFTLGKEQHETIKETVKLFDALAILKKVGIDPRKAGDAETHVAAPPVATPSIWERFRNLFRSPSAS